MGRKEIIGFVSVLIAFMSAAVIPTVGHTEGNPNASIGYSVQKVSPGNEVNSSSSFYDLAVTPGEQRTIEAKLINPTDEPIVVVSRIFTASTNNNGEINYTMQPVELDQSLKHQVSELAVVAASDVKTEIAPHSENIVHTTINVPQDVEPGVLLGSWYFEKEGQTDDTDDEGIVINNKYSYAMAIKLTVQHEIEQPNMNLMTITSGLNNYRKVINANLQNDRPAIIGNLAVSAKITEKGKYDVLYENESDGMIMAPNSNFAYPVFLKEQPLKAGDYTMRVTATSDDPKWESQRWEWTEDFTITADEARQINEEALNDPEQPTSWLLYVVIALIILVIILIILLYRKRKRVV
ncbi:DUF916 and DUF3324 domain-containing protein [Enterococcus sp. AZ109]|uniref:DUF916 and DUF3324 domain-containing protein n=1 Tax=Enterococcus sp. AZ109 TaxID=2774634 RepID=UPI003F26DC60